MTIFLFISPSVNVVSLSADVVAEQAVPSSVFAITVGHGGHVDDQDGVGQQQVDRRRAQPSTTTSMRCEATALAEPFSSYVFFLISRVNKELETQFCFVMSLNLSFSKTKQKTCEVNLKRETREISDSED